jgi:hypothetical protein
LLCNNLQQWGLLCLPLSHNSLRLGLVCLAADFPTQTNWLVF